MARLPRVAGDPEGTVQRSQPEVVPGDLPLSVLVDADESARVPDGYRPSRGQSGGPHGCHPIARDGVKRLRRRKQSRPAIKIHVEQPGVVLVDAPAGSALAQDVNGLPKGVALLFGNCAERERDEIGSDG